MDLEAELQKSMAKDELESQIGGKIDSFHGLLTREVAIRLIAKERGLLRSEDRTFRLSEIPKGEKRVRFSAKVRKIWPIAAYSSGKRSRVVEVEDETGSMPLILWNDDILLSKSLRSKDRVEVKGAYEKNGELHLGYSGGLDVSEKAPFSILSGMSDGHGHHIRGFVSAVEGMDRFVKESRSLLGYSFMLSDGKTERRCILFGAQARAGNIEAGDEIIIEDAEVRNGNIEIDAHTRMLFRRARDMLIGEVTALECGGDSLHVEVGGKKAVFDREGALRFLGVEAAPDIALSTVVALKKEALINSRIAVKLGQKVSRR